MTTHTSTPVSKSKYACEIEVGTVIVTPGGLGIVVDIATDEVDHYMGFYGVVQFTVEYADGTVDSIVYQDGEKVEIGFLTIEVVDAIITAHTSDCPEGNPDACEECDALWSARADANI